MSLLKQARTVYEGIKAKRNGHAIPSPTRLDGPLSQSPRCEKSEKSEISPPTYLLLDQPGDLRAVLTALDDADLVALDTETTGLDPRIDRMRLLSLALPTIDGGTFTYLIDCFAV